MSNTRTAAIADIPSLETTGSRKITAKDRLPFRIDGVVFHLLKPKSAMLGQAAALLDPGRPYTDDENAQVLMQFVGQLIGYIQHEPSDKDSGELRGRMLLEKRLSDPMDALDLEDLLPLFTKIMDGWFKGRPTGSPRASSAPRRAPRAGGSRASTR